MDWEHFQSCSLLSLTLHLSHSSSVFLIYKLPAICFKVLYFLSQVYFFWIYHVELTKRMSDLVRLHYSFISSDHSLVYWTMLVPALIFYVPVLENSPPENESSKLLFPVPQNIINPFKVFHLILCHLNCSSELLLMDIYIFKTHTALYLQKDCFLTVFFKSLFHELEKWCWFYTGMLQWFMCSPVLASIIFNANYQANEFSGMLIRLISL